MIFYIVYGLIFLILIVLSVMAAKHLHWINAVIVVLLFLSTAAASLGMAGVLFKRSKAVKKLNTIETKTVAIRKDYNDAVFGDANSIGFGKNSLRAKTAELDLLLVGRGRVWNGGTATAAEGEWTYAFPSPVPPGSEDQLKLLEGMEVNVFSERPLTVTTSEGPKPSVIPVGYIGKFRIVEAKNEGFILEAVRIINREEATNPTSTWTIFEKMPLDRRGSFKQALAAINPDADFEKMSISDFRRVLETQFFPADNFPFEADSVQYEKLIDRYAFDGRSLGQIDEWVESQSNSGNRKSGAFQPLPEEVQVKYRFNKESREYTVDATGSLDTDGAFTPLGLAISPDLHLNSTVKFKKDDEVVVDSLTALGYERDGTPIEPFSTSEDVTEIDRIYVRQNQDFPYLFSQLSSRGVTRLESLQDRKADNNLYDNTISKNLAQQIQERTALQAELESDNRNLEVDVETISGVTTASSEEINSLVQRLQQAKREQDALRAQLGQIARRVPELASGPVESFSEEPQLSPTISVPFDSSVPLPMGQSFPMGQPMPMSQPIGQPMSQPFGQPLNQSFEMVPPQQGMPIPESFEAAPMQEIPLQLGPAPQMNYSPNGGNTGGNDFELFQSN